MLKMRQNKKGISPLIATVLLVGLVIIVGLLFYLFAKKQIAVQIEKIECGPQEQLNVDIGATCARGDIEETTDVVEGTVVTVSNIGQRTVDGIRIVCTPPEGSGRDTKSPPPTPLNCKSGEECHVTYNEEYNCEQVEILPGVVIEDEFNLCTDKSITVLCAQTGV